MTSALLSPDGSSSLLSVALGVGLALRRAAASACCRWTQGAVSPELSKAAVQPAGPVLLLLVLLLERVAVLRRGAAAAAEGVPLAVPLLMRCASPQPASTRVRASGRTANGERCTRRPLRPRAPARPAIGVAAPARLEDLHREQLAPPIES